MAGTSMRDVRRRIHSVENTMQITKAMQLVAASKLRRAKERVETARPYFTTLYDTIRALSAGSAGEGGIYTRQRPVRRSAYLVLGGDRGLAGGYNANLFRFAEEVMDPEAALVVPVGKRAVDHYSRTPYEVRPFGGYTVLEDMDLARSFELARLLTELFRSGEVDEVNFVYTEFRSMLSQVPVVKKILPLSFEDEEDAPAAFGAAEFDPSPAAVLGRIIPQYVGGMVFGAVSEAFASEQGARRMAMENASDNAEEMIASLSLQYNRARQGAITQEITEISSGFEALR